MQPMVKSLVRWLAALTGGLAAGLGFGLPWLLVNRWHHRQPF